MRERSRDTTKRNKTQWAKWPQKQDWKYDQRRENKQFRQNIRVDHKEKHEAPIKINRKETTPFLVRLFYTINNENLYLDSTLPPNQIYLHLWNDTTLRQIAEILRAYLPAIRTKQKFIFSKVVEGENKKMNKQQLGVVIVHRKSDRFEQKSLGGCKFVPGQYLDVSINYK